MSSEASPGPSSDRPNDDPRSRMTQPEQMKCDEYVYGVNPVNGNDAWTLFGACAAGDRGQVDELLAKDRRLVNAQFWYQFPLHMAVLGNHVDIAELLLESGADPGESRFTYNSWDRLIRMAVERQQHTMTDLLERTMARKFGYSSEFDILRSEIIERDVAEIHRLLDEHPALARCSDTLGNTALHWAVLTRQPELFDLFLQRGASIDAPRADGQTPAILAVNQANDYWYREARRKDHPSLRNVWVILGVLLAKGAAYSISLAAAAGDLLRVKQIVESEVSLATRRDSNRVSPLSYAAREGHQHIVKFLLDHGADPNLPEDLAPKGRALFEACGGNHYDTARLLLEHGADPNGNVDSCGCCLTIVKFHHPKSYKPLDRLLREYGAVTPPYAMTRRELSVACQQRQNILYDPEFIGVVLGRNDRGLLDDLFKADPSVNRRLQVYDKIHYPRSPRLMELLLKNGLDPNRTDWLGRTVLHACAENGDTSIAQTVLTFGGDINARDVEYRGTPLATAVRTCPAVDHHDAAAARRHRRMIRFLLRRGALTEHPGDPAWATPLAWAQRNGLGDIADMLTRHTPSH